MNNIPFDIRTTGDSAQMKALRKPNSMWFVIHDSGYDVVRVSADGNGFFVPGQDPCWGFDSVAVWIKEIKPEEMDPRFKERLRFKCEPMTREFSESEKKIIENHRAWQCPDGGKCQQVHLALPLWYSKVPGVPDGPSHGCVVCGEPVA